MAMRQTIEADLQAPPAQVYAALAELDGYSAWLDLIHAVEDADPATADPGPAWLVTLRATVGPFARAKRLRMVRTISDEPTQLRFERAEVDGRTHAPWTLDVGIEAHGTGSNVTVELRYDGSLWTKPLEAVLGAQIESAVPRLRQHVGG